MTEGFRGLSEVVEVWRKLDDATCDRVQIVSPSLHSVLTRADAYMAGVEGEESVNEANI